jgi:predicted O-methyltransferase YrrM
MLKKFSLRLTNSDWLALILVLGLLLVVSKFGGVVGLSIVSALLIIFLLLEQHRRVLEQIARRGSDYKQTEALFHLFQQINPRRRLPPTRGWAISPDFACLILDTIAQSKPANILDLGGGVSTLVAGYASEKYVPSAKIVALEHDAAYVPQIVGYISEHGLEKNAQVIHVPLTTVAISGHATPWYDLSKISARLPSVDLLIVDGPPERLGSQARYPAVPLLYPKLSQQAVILVDDAASPEMRVIIKRWQEEYPDLVAQSYPAEKGAVLLRRVAK